MSNRTEAVNSDIVQRAATQVNQAHDTASSGPVPPFGTIEHVAYSAWCTLVFDAWVIASQAIHTPAGGE